MTVGLIIAGIALALFYGIYVSLVKKKNNLKEAAAGIDVQLKKRYDLIPNLLKAAAKYMEHEKDVFMKVTELREKAMNAAGYEERFKAEQQLSEAMHGFRLTAVISALAALKEPCNICLLYTSPSPRDRG